MDAAATLAIIAPRLADSPQAAGAVALARTMVDPCALGAQVEAAVAYLAAHILTVAQRDEDSAGAAGAGAVASVRTGDLAVSYGAGAAVRMEDADLATTPFGLGFLRLRDHSLAGMPAWVM